MKNANSLLVGILAGAASALMLFAAHRSGLGAVVLLAFAPVAIYIAAMGWGTLAGIAGALAASAAVLMFSSPASAAAAAALIFAPAAWVGHLSNLGQPGSDGKTMVWYPLSGILFRLMLATFAAFILTGYLAGYGEDSVVPAFVALMQEFSSANPSVPVPPEADMIDRARFYTKIIPVVVPATWLLINVLMAHLSSSIVRRSGLMARPRDDIAASLALPLEAVGFLVAGLIGMMILPPAGRLASGVALGVGIAGFGVVGLAELHLRTRGRDARGFMLFATYALIVMFSVPFLLFTVTGLWRTVTRNRPPANNGGTA